MRRLMWPLETLRLPQHPHVETDQHIDRNIRSNLSSISCRLKDAHDLLLDPVSQRQNDPLIFRILDVLLCISKQHRKVLINGKRQQRGCEQVQTLSEITRGSKDLVYTYNSFFNKQGLDHLREQIFLALGEMVIQCCGRDLNRVGDLFHGDAFIAFRKKEFLSGCEDLPPRFLVEM